MNSKDLSGTKSGEPYTWPNSRTTTRQPTRYLIIDFPPFVQFTSFSFFPSRFFPIFMPMCNFLSYSFSSDWKSWRLNHESMNKVVKHYSQILISHHFHIFCLFHLFFSKNFFLYNICVIPIIMIYIFLKNWVLFKWFHIKMIPVYLC